MYSERICVFYFVCCVLRRFRHRGKGTKGEWRGSRAAKDWHHRSYLVLVAVVVIVIAVAVDTAVVVCFLFANIALLPPPLLCRCSVAACRSALLPVEARPPSFREILLGI